jgi:hypothetical protein
MSFQELKTDNLDLSTINQQSLASFLSSGTGTGVARDFAIYTGNPTAPFLMDSGVKSDSGNNITGAASFTTITGASIKQIQILGHVGNQLEFDNATGFPNNQLLAYDDTTNTLLLISGANGTKDANLSIAQNSTNPAKTFNITSTHGPINLHSATDLSIQSGTHFNIWDAYGSVSSTIHNVIMQGATGIGAIVSSNQQVILQEVNDIHSVTLDASGINIQAGNNLPVTLNNVGGVLTMSTGLGIDATAATGKAATMHSDTSVELHETTDNHQLLMNSTAVCLAANNGKPLHLTSGAGQNITLNTGVTVSPGAVLYAYVTITPTLYLAGATATITNTVAAGGANYPLVWPSTQGGAGTKLTNDGAGNLSWT